VQALEERPPHDALSLRRAAWAGLLTGRVPHALGRGEAADAFAALAGISPRAGRAASTSSRRYRFEALPAVLQ
jgi:hypothetical protein